MPTKEATIKLKITKVLKEEGVMYHMPVQNGMGRPTLDYIGCCNGRFFAIEAKALKRTPTERQWLTSKEMVSSGGIVFVIDKEEEINGLRDWISHTRSHPPTLTEFDIARGCEGSRLYSAYHLKEWEDGRAPQAPGDTGPP